MRNTVRLVAHCTLSTARIPSHFRYGSAWAFRLSIYIQQRFACVQEADKD